MARRKEMHFIANGYGVRGNKVLLGFHRKENKWLPLGGHMEKGETPEDALRREFREESGLEIAFSTQKEYDSKRVRFLHPPQKMNLVSGGKDHPKHINLIYFCKVKEGRAKISWKEHKKLKWFSKKDLQRITLEPDVKASAREAIDFVAKR